VQEFSLAAQKNGELQPNNNLQFVLFTSIQAISVELQQKRKCRAMGINPHTGAGTPNNTLHKVNSPKGRETAQYIADMALELRNMTKPYEMKTLQGLLEVLFYEASTEANRVIVPPEELEHLRMLEKASAS
jgi:hypothetical protein